MAPLLTVLTLAGATLCPMAARAFVLVTAPDGTPVTWRERCVEVWMNPLVAAELTPEEGLDALDAAVATWNAVDYT